LQRALGSYMQEKCDYPYLGSPVPIAGAKVPAGSAASDAARTAAVHHHLLRRNT